MSRSRSISAWALPIGLMVLGALFGFFLVAADGQPYEGRIVDSSIDTTGDVVIARVNWVGPGGTIEGARLTLPAGIDTESTVLVRVSDGKAEVVSSSFATSDIWIIALGALVGLLLGIVVHLSLGGYGYVRGTGQPGETPPEQVREDRGFYWRQ